MCDIDDFKPLFLRILDGIGRPAAVPGQIADAYEQSLTYCFYDWGPIAWAMLCVFVLPFAYHYYIKRDNELKFSALCKYAVGERAVKGAFGKIVDFLFIFSAIGSIAITAGTAASTIAATIVVILAIIYKGFLAEMFKAFKSKSREEILAEGAVTDEPAAAEK